MLDPILNTLLDGSTFGVIAVAMIVAYRFTKRAHEDANKLYKSLSEDSAARLEKERVAWSVDREALITRIQQLEAMNDHLANLLGKTGTDDSLNNHPDGE